MISVYVLYHPQLCASSFFTPPMRVRGLWDSGWYKFPTFLLIREVIIMLIFAVDERPALFQLYSPEANCRIHIMEGADNC